ncbi:MAG: stimulus-sensing domain-containing protein, partial [Alphaproteobacteria bacterium]
QGEIISGAFAEGAIASTQLRGGGADARIDTPEILLPEMARPILRRLVKPTQTRARLFAADGGLVADSRQLTGSGGAVQVEALEPVDAQGYLSTVILDAYEALITLLPNRDRLQPYREQRIQRADDYREVVAALKGEAESAVRVHSEGGLVISVAVPVQRLKQVHGALMLTTGSTEVERAVREVRMDILRIFAVALAITVLLSFYLANAIARPVRRLAAAADGVRRDHQRAETIPDFSSRNDEIGELSGALRDMTEDLWRRMDAIESFAADVAHEIKNPLSSLRSAVETASRVSDPEQQRKLMTIIFDDVQRLDRLITDISDASRLDTELARVTLEPVDLGQLLSTLVQVHQSGSPDDRPVLSLQQGPGGPLIVRGDESRLVQVFQNLIANAFSFSPPGGTVRLNARKLPDSVEVTVEDEGPGVPESSLESIFQRFYTERPEGEKFGLHSGLGLSISQQIIEAHGGSIVAQNRRGDAGAVKGARLIVRLPRAD